MRIAPVDIRNQQFKKVVRGADPEEVRIFLAIVADEMERLISANRELEETTSALAKQVDEYRKLEMALRDTLLTAEKVSSEARENSRKEAELVLRDAGLKAERILDEASRRASELRREIVELKNQKDIYIARLRSLVETQLKILRFHSVDMEEQEEAIAKLGQTQSKLRLETSGTQGKQRSTPEKTVGSSSESRRSSRESPSGVSRPSGREPEQDEAEQNQREQAGTRQVSRKPDSPRAEEESRAAGAPYVEVRTKEGD